MRQAYDLCGAAIRAGCDDPLVLYGRARMYGSTELKSPAQDLKLHVDAAAAMKETGGRYHAMRQGFCFARAADSLARSKKTLDDDEKQEIRDWLDLALSRFGEGAADPEVPEKQLQDVAELLSGTWMQLTRDRLVGFTKIFDALTKARPDSTLPLVLKGEFYTQYAWDARGSGWASTVTDEGWKRMRERLGEAEKALTAAWTRNPADPQAPTLMIGVELGQGKGRAVMEAWYKRAMEADPDNLDACQKKMYYLEPKWHGSPEAMLGFGRELLAIGNWEARLPLQLVEAHMTLAAYGEKPADYYQDNRVWQDIQEVYDRMLRHNPKSTWDRSYYARMACYCGRWSEAKAQFDKLGADAEVTAFADAAEFHRLKARAAEKGK
jgi:tetratricopeptide (TPR) repeat protein